LFQGRLSREVMGRVVGYGKFTLLTNGAGMLFHSTDRLMLGFMLGPASVALYSVGAKLVQLTEVLVTAAGQVYFVRYCANKDMKPGQQLLEAVSLLWALLLPMMAGLVVLLALFPGLTGYIFKGYDPPLLLMALLLGGSLLLPLMRQFGSLLDSRGKPDRNFINILAVTVLNILLNALFIPFWGVYGAAMATLLSTFLLCLFILYIVLFKYKIGPQRFLVEILGWYKRLLGLVKDKVLS